MLEPPRKAYEVQLPFECIDYLSEEVNKLSFSEWAPTELTLRVKTFQTPLHEDVKVIPSPAVRFNP